MKTDRTKKKVLAICSPNASGKSGLAVKLARQFNGEIISADSRQIYRGLDISSGKITKKEMRGIPHHLLDIANPKKRLTAAEYQKLAREKILEIFSRGHQPIICGGTGFYVQSIVDNVVLPNVLPNKKLRGSLEKESAEKLFKMLKKLDAKRAKKIDPSNKRRLIRAIEIAKALGKVPPINLRKQLSKNSFQFLQIGIKTDKEKLRQKISDRLIKRMRIGLVSEAKKLHASGLSWKRMDELGLEYRFLAKYLKGEMSKAKMLERLKIETWHYAKRQMTWFKKDKRIKWFKLEDVEDIKKEISKFLS